jgi:hypothetical protein
LEAGDDRLPPGEVRSRPRNGSELMTISQSDYPSVTDRAGELGVQLPGGLVFLPENFQTAEAGDELRFRGEATTVAKLFRQVGLTIERLGTPDQSAFIHNKSHDWALPIIFVGAELMQQSPDVVRTAIELIRDHVVKLFEGTADKKIKTEVVIEDRRRQRYQKITYEGDAAGLGEVAKLIGRMRR